MKRMNFEYLLGGLLFLILSFALAQEQGVTVETRRLFLEPVLCLMLLTGIWTLKKEKKWLLILGGIMALAGFAMATVDFFWSIAWLRLINVGILLMFCVVSTGIASQHLLQSSAIDVNKIIGAICIYLLLGLIWAIAYMFINLAFPNSFHGLTSLDIGTQLTELLYYSFVTLTSLGYGDLIPVKPMARTVTYLEAIAGQFYVAVLVAWLVGMYLSGRDHNRPKSSGWAQP